MEVMFKNQVGFGANAMSWRVARRIGGAAEFL